MAEPFRKIPRLSSWRRLALHAWPAPRDPTVYSTLQVDMTAALRFLEEIRERSGVRVTVTHLVIKAIAEALRRYPDSNAIIRRRWIYLRDRVDVFAQVVLDDGEDLGGMKIERADEKPIAEVAREMHERVEKIRAHRDAELETSKKMLDRVPNSLLGIAMRLTEFASHGLGLDLTRFGLKPDPFGGAMVSSIATFGIDWALAPIVPFSRCPIVLLVGTVQTRPFVVDGRVEARPVLIVGTTFDHRLLDGAQASRLARVVIDVLADPVTHLEMPAVPNPARRERVFGAAGS
jgi:pyruvate/2-oxoglutarate dehydrogenase complex dihydrolipoamide acyltransferase (E2) component